jgi:hypothetical protein
MSISTKDKWFLNNECSRHMMGDKNKFTSLTLKDGRNVTLREGQRLLVKSVKYHLS